MHEGLTGGNITGFYVCFAFFRLSLSLTISFLECRSFAKEHKQQLVKDFDYK